MREDGQLDRVTLDAPARRCSRPALAAAALGRIRLGRDPIDPHVPLPGHVRAPPGLDHHRADRVDQNGRAGHPLALGQLAEAVGRGGLAAAFFEVGEGCDEGRGQGGGRGKPILRWGLWWL